ncbi:hypothetical protein NDJ22_10585 [Vibrio alginolyticus]|nr:hypothetical protein [Vibrio alginolyticus]
MRNITILHQAPLIFAHFSITKTKYVVWYLKLVMGHQCASSDRPGTPLSG